VVTIALDSIFARKTRFARSAHSIRACGLW